jgi:hypothetical protein
MATYSSLNQQEMSSFLHIIKYDFLQRIRSYRFLIICCFSIGFAYLLVPAPESNYTTIRLGRYMGEYNSSWIAYSTAMMSSVFLGLIGFYLINGGLKKDLDTGIGQILASTNISNRTYLLAKMSSNLAVLSSLLFLVMIVSMSMFFLYSSNQTFEPGQFIKAYFLIPFPTMVFTAGLSVLLEAIIINKAIIQNIIVYGLFSAIIGMNANSSDANFNIDLFGTETISNQMVEQVKKIAPDENIKLNIGFMVGSHLPEKVFGFQNPPLDLWFMVTRLLWILSIFFVIMIIAPYFHRFDIKKNLLKKKKERFTQKKIVPAILDLNQIPTLNFNPSIIPIIKVELTMMIRNSSKWISLISGGLMIALAFSPYEVAHQILLPIVWFLQIEKLSCVTTREQAHHLEYLTFSSYKPLYRLMTAQLSSAMILLILISLPLTLRLIFVDLEGFVEVHVGILFLVLLSSALGAISKGKRLFEALFFFLTYFALNKITFADYYGGFHEGGHYLLLLTSIVMILACITYGFRHLQLTKN